MFNRNALLLVAGAAIFALDASAGLAQDTTTTRPRSQRRIPIAKEAPGEVVPMHDTVTVYRTDTLTMYRRDTVTLTTTNTVTRTDTVVQTIPAVVRQIGGLYFGLGAGTALPFGALQTVNNPAWAVQGQVGWQGVKNVLGVRADVNYDRYSDDDFYATLAPHPDVVNGNLDLKLQLPIVNHLFGANPRFSLYAIGGGSYITYRNLRMKLDAGDVGYVGIGPQNAMIAGNDDSWHDSWGWNVGGGLQFHWGGKELFAEARVIQFERSDFHTSREIPIMFGMNWF